MEDKMKNLQDKMNKTVLKEIRFEEKHKQNVLRTVGSLNNLSSSVIKKHRYSLGRKFTYSVCSVALLFTLFIGSAFFSPAMAEVVSKIPYLSKIFHSEPINRIIWGELEEKGYEINGVSGNASHILIKLNGSEQYFQDVHEEVKEIAAKILKSNEYDRYTIKVKREIDIEVPPTSEREKAIGEALNRINDQLIKLNFNVLSYGASYPSENSNKVIIEIDVPNTEKRIEEIKEITNEILRVKNIESYSIKINKIDLIQREKEAKWSEIFPTIYEGLTARSEYKVTGLTYSFHPAPLQIIISTSIYSSDKDAPEKVHIIEKTINEFLNSKEIKSKIDGEPYKIIIRSKDKQKIN
ncbi:DUF4030 domain-containing protein [Peribacillus simplex]|uniref:DUF4030 domain-containing protein n=2 Tax=Peribacillus TaxID=2675229 RepID=A0AA90T5A1_9BACI|nr:MULTISPECIES: DUF4030 domain-containing protein [Peribacillus]MDP1420085.1 DUF4030 domain-containing protein [Peribacillus simplex]MDP1454573.1 DUF4030 domain-containing protein [Peribacillus frigoritolerans]